MKHLNHVESIELGFWSQELNSYPASWRASSLQGSIQEEQPSGLYHKANPGQMLLSCMPCIPNATSMDNEDEPSSVGNPLRFPNIRTARLRRSSQWFTDHCPNLERFFDAGYVKKWEFLDLVALGVRCPRVQTLDTLLVASPNLILGKQVGSPPHLYSY